MQTVCSGVKAAVKRARLGREPIINGILARNLKNQVSSTQVG
jgi:hypothetical protein